MGSLPGPNPMHVVNARPFLGMLFGLTMFKTGLNVLLSPVHGGSPLSLELELEKKREEKKDTLFLCACVLGAGLVRYHLSLCGMHRSSRWAHHRWNGSRHDFFPGFCPPP